MNSTLTFKPHTGKARILISAIIVLILLLIWPLKVLKGEPIHEDNRLLYETAAYEDMHLISPDDYVSGVIEGTGDTLSHISFYARNLSPHQEDFFLRCTLFSSDGAIFSHTIAIPVRQESYLYRIPVGLALTAGQQYQLVILSESSGDLLVRCQKNTADPVVILHADMDSVSTTVSLLRFLIYATCYVTGGIILYILLFIKECKQPLFITAVTGMVLVFSFLFLTDFLPGNSRAVFGSIGFVIVLILYVLSALFFPQKRQTVMIALLLSAGLFYLLFMPRGIVPDERTHFYRAFDISCGNLLPVRDEATGEGGNVLPAALHNFSSDTAEIDWTQCDTVSFSSMAFYSFICYLPQALFIRIARFFTANVAAIFMAGRLGAFCFSALFTILALRIMPVAKELLFLTVMLPMTVMESASLSADAITNALVIFYIAYVLHLSMQTDPSTLPHRAWAVLIACGIALSLCKVVYVIVILLLMILPLRTVKEKRMRVLALILPVITCAFSNILHSRYVMTYIAGANAKGQIVFLLTHPVRGVLILLRSLMESGGLWFETMTTLRLPSDSLRTFAPTMLLLFGVCLYEILHSRFPANGQSKAIRLWSGTTFFATFICVLASLYLVWAEVGGGLVRGVYGRYFLCILPLLYVFILSHRTCAGKDTSSENHPVEPAPAAMQLTDPLLVFALFMTLLDLIRIYDMRLMTG